MCLYECEISGILKQEKKWSNYDDVLEMDSNRFNQSIIYYYYHHINFFFVFESNFRHCFFFLSLINRLNIKLFLVSMYLKDNDDIT